MATKRMPTGLVIRDRSIKIWFMYRGKRCWESLPLKPTTANIRHATKLREEICTRIAIGVFDYAEFFPHSKRAEETERSPTFREMAETWLSTVNQLSHSTLSRYRGMLNSHVLPKIGDIPIDSIQYSTLAGLLATLDCSAKTRNNIATVIRQPFVLALRDGRIKDNPAQHLANAKVQKEPPDPFTLEEAEAILGYLKNEPVFHNYFELAFFSGMRTSELIALTWQDIDFQRQCMRVTQHVEMAFSGLKNPGSLEPFTKLEIEHILPDNPKPELCATWAARTRMRSMTTTRIASATHRQQM